MKRLLKIISLLLAVVLSVSFMQAYVMRPWDFNHIRTKGFYLEPKDSIDIVLLGQSDIVRCWSPIHAYDISGHTSYAFACDGITAAMWKPLTRSAIKHQHPGLLVVDVNSVLYDEEMELHRPFDQQMCDDMPYDEIRFALAMDARKTGSERWQNYLFPLREYHSGYPKHWKDVPKQIRTIRDLEKRGYTYFKGDAQTCASEKARTVLTPEKGMKKMELSPKYRKVLDDYLDYCDQENLNILFVQSPHRIPNEKSKLYKNLQRSIDAGEIIEERGYPFINTEFMADEIGLDVQADFYNNGHLNWYGQQKYTEWLLDEIENRRMVLPPPERPEIRKEWDICSEYYRAYVEYLPEFTAPKITDMCWETPELIGMLEERMQ